jgi:tRNA nucleotidyltransferase (CCA-adding enzyme)
MKADEYLQKILESQKLAEDSAELKTLRDRRDEIEGHLREAFGSSPKIRYGGSHAKRTLIKDSYDLDLVCYFARDGDAAGETLEKIYNSVKDVLTKHYPVALTKISS